MMKVKLDNIRKIIRTRFRWKCVDGELFRQEPYIFCFGRHYDFVHQPPYTVLQRIAEMERLKVELKDAKYESLDISSDLTEASRQGQIEKRVEESGLELKINNQPVYRIQKGKK